MLYTGLRPFCFPSLLCLNQRPALALSLELYHVGKNAALMQQLCRRSLFCYCSIFEHHNLICTGNRAHPVSDDEDGFVFNKPGQSLLNGSFVLHIQAGGGLVQQDDGRILQEGTGDRNALTLAAGKGAAVLADVGVSLVRQLFSLAT